MAKTIQLQLSEPLASGQHACVSADGRDLVVCRVDDAYFAFDNICPHAGLPLGDGELTGCVITCPYHGYAFNIRTGANVDYPDDPAVATYPVTVDGVAVSVGIAEG